MIIRNDLISRKAAWEAVRQMHGITEGVGILKIVGRGEGEMVDRDKVEYMLQEIDPVPPQAPNLLAERDRLRELCVDILALWDKHGFGDSEEESGPIYERLGAALAKAEKDPIASI